MKKRYNKTRNTYFVRLLYGVPWFYERDDPRRSNGRMAGDLMVLASLVAAGVDWQRR